jgi:hypothetical protein
MKNKIVSFSGGQTSALMLRKIMDANPSTFDSEYRVIYCNNEREHDATRQFVQECGNAWGVNITWLEYDRVDDEHTFKEVNYESASRRGDAMDGPFSKMLEWSKTLPNVRSRQCSGQLKVRTMRRYLQAMEMKTWESFIGIRADESDRASFRLNIPNHMGNCDLCFLKAKWKRMAIMREDPDAAAWWIGWEDNKRAVGVTNDGARWISGKSYAGELAMALHPEFAFMAQDTTEQDIPCSCAVGGYREENLQD